MAQSEIESHKELATEKQQPTYPEEKFPWVTLSAIGISLIVLVAMLVELIITSKK